MLEKLAQDVQAAVQEKLAGWETKWMNQRLGQGLKGPNLRDYRQVRQLMDFPVPRNVAARTQELPPQLRSLDPGTAPDRDLLSMDTLPRWDWTNVDGGGDITLQSLMDSFKRRAMLNK